MRYARFIMAPALCLVLACAAGTASPGEPSKKDMDAFIGHAMVVTADAPATVPVGTEFAVVLDENPSTGYQWSYTITPDGAVEEIAKDSFSKTEKPLIGAGVVTVWKFRTKAEGEAVITYLYYRPWEKPETSVDKKVFTINIVR